MFECASDWQRGLGGECPAEGFEGCEYLGDAVTEKLDFSNYMKPRHDNITIRRSTAKFMNYLCGPAEPHLENGRL